MEHDDAQPSSPPPNSVLPLPVTQHGPSRGSAARALDLVGKLSHPLLEPAVRHVGDGGHLDAPLVVELDPTSFCDLGCPECISGPLLRNGQFSNRRLIELGEELIAAGVRAVILIGGGEPLLHQKTGELISLLDGAGVAVGVTTNGTQLSRHMSVIATHAAWTRVSVDAATQATYEVIRPHRGRTSPFTAVVESMRELATRKKGLLGFSFLLVSRRGTDSTVTATNAHEITAAAALARDIGCDYFELKPEYDLAHFVREQPQAQVQLLRSQLRATREFESPTFSVLTPAHLDDVLDGRSLVQNKSYQECPTIEFRTLLTAQGAYACPYHRGNPQARYGDPTTDSVIDLWQGQRRRHVADALDPSQHCRFHCIRHQSNLYVLGQARASREGSAAADNLPLDPFI